MTLFEAIRGLKEGQAIEGIRNFDFGEHLDAAIEPGYRAAEWRWGEPEAEVLRHTVSMLSKVRIIDLPKPKMSLEEGLRSALARRIVYQLDARAMADHLRSLPIDWQAEADRKEGK